MESTTAAHRFCPTCGASVEDGWRFCRACGAPQADGAGGPPPPATTPAPVVAAAKDPSLFGASPSNVKLIYILYLVGLVVGITVLVGVVMAYVNRGEADDWLRTHYRFQIRTFWIGLLYSVVGVVLALAIVGLFVLLFAFVWYVVRCIKGLQAVGGERPVENAGSWFFG